MANDWAVRNLDLRIEGLVLPIGLEIDEAVVSGSDVSVQPEPLSIDLGPDATATVRISCDSILSYLSTLDITGLRDVTVESENGLLKVSGTVTVLVAIRATAYCDLVARDGKALDIVVKRADPGAAQSLIEKQLKGINPILDLSGLPMNIRITSVEIADGWVTIEGESA